MKIISMFFILLLMTSCSRIDLAVSLAPRLISNEIDDALDLDSDRYKKIKEAITKDIEKNSKPLFTEINVSLEHLLQLTEKNEISPDDLGPIAQEFKDLQKKVVTAFAASFSEVILQISRTEISNLKEYALEKKKKSDEILTDKNKFYRNYMKTYEHYADLFMNSSNREQEIVFKDFLDDSRSYYQSRNQERMDSLKQFDRLFASKKELLDFNLSYYAGETLTKSDDFVKKQETFRKQFLVFISKFWNLSSPGQKNHFRKYLTDTRAELKKIISKE